MRGVRSRLQYGARCTGPQEGRAGLALWGADCERRTSISARNLGNLLTSAKARLSPVRTRKPRSAAKDAPLSEGFEDIDDVVAQSESDSRRAPYLEKARRDLAEREPDRIKGLAALRLRKGWSQKRLAAEVGTSPPHIAGLEIGHEDILMETARRLAAALEVSIADIDAALLAQKQQR